VLTNTLVHSILLHKEVDMVRNQARTRPTINFSLDASVVAWLRNTAKKNGVPASLLVERIVNFFMRNPMILANIFVIHSDQNDDLDSAAD